MEAACLSSNGLSRSGPELAQSSPGKSWGEQRSLPSPGDHSPTAADGRKGSGVKKHHHKHNLKHRYELLETLGRGTYGKVKKAIERHSGREVAIKSIRKEKIKDEQDMVHIRREIEIMSSLRHPHIISIYEVFENKDKIVIVMEYASKGELYDYISERRRLSERETRRFFRQIVSAVHYCHKLYSERDSRFNEFRQGATDLRSCPHPPAKQPQRRECWVGLPIVGTAGEMGDVISPAGNAQWDRETANQDMGMSHHRQPRGGEGAIYRVENGVVHRDLKLENVLLDENCNIKIADFGLSNLYHKDKLLQTFCGSPLYASPEIVNGRPYRGPEVDSWALGVLLYTLVYGTMPFDGGDHKNLIRQISNGEYREPTQSSDARGLIRWMLMVNPERRATVEDIASHWWVNWGCKSSVCDCEPQREAGGSPMLARLIYWQNRVEPKPTKTVRPETAPFARQRPKKSKKENEAGPAGGGGEEKAGLKRPKGILKTRPVGDQHSHGQGALQEGAVPHTQDGDSGSSPEREDEEPALAGGSPPKMVPSLPKKGILKNSQQRESGYYSSPERSESSELLGGASVLLSRASSPPKRAVGRKGILKRNGKYSSHNAPATGVAVVEPLPGDSGLSRSQSRPSSIVADDSGLSPSSFSGADWPPTAPRPNIRGCVSAENLLQLASFRGLRAAPTTPLHTGKIGQGGRGSPGDNGSFSLLGDLDDVTQVYQQALDICSMLGNSNAESRRRALFLAPALLFWNSVLTGCCRTSGLRYSEECLDSAQTTTEPGLGACQPTALITDARFCEKERARGGMGRGRRGKGESAYVS
ncbi:hypothetical protein JZ751_016771, partial [Albula glossodonta]